MSCAPHPSAPRPAELRQALAGTEIGTTRDHETVKAVFDRVQQLTAASRRCARAASAVAAAAVTALIECGCPHPRGPCGGSDWDLQPLLLAVASPSLRALYRPCRSTPHARSRSPAHAPKPHAPSPRSLRCCGSCAMNICGVACGRLDVFFEVGGPACALQRPKQTKLQTHSHVHAHACAHTHTRMPACVRVHRHTYVRTSVSAPITPLAPADRLWRLLGRGGGRHHPAGSRRAAARPQRRPLARQQPPRARRQRPPRPRGRGGAQGLRVQQTRAAGAGGWRRVKRLTLCALRLWLMRGAMAVVLPAAGIVRWWRLCCCAAVLLRRYALFALGGPCSAAVLVGGFADFVVTPK